MLEVTDGDPAIRTIDMYSYHLGYETGQRDRNLHTLFVGVLLGAFGVGCYWGFGKAVLWLIHAVV